MDDGATYPPAGTLEHNVAAGDRDWLALSRKKRPPPLRRAAPQARRTATVSLMLSFANPEPQAVAKSATWNTCRAGSLSGGGSSPFAKPAYENLRVQRG